jgi:tRNA threonylcarbamoyl adenosine modification protein (Sua5/YciO/YrdC/YwlC family)
MIGAARWSANQRPSRDTDARVAATACDGDASATGKGPVATRGRAVRAWHASRHCTTAVSRCAERAVCTLLQGQPRNTATPTYDRSPHGIRICMDRLRVHLTHPQPRLLQQAADRLQRGELALLPTDAGYVLAWGIDARDAEERVLRLRALDTRHPFTLLCRAISEISSLAKLDDQAFRLIKSLIPGPYTFILPAASELPRRLKQSKRRDIGCRIPDNEVTRSLLEVFGSPLLSTSVVLPDEELDSHDSEAVAEHMARHVDLMLDAEDCPPGPTSVVDLTGDSPLVTRQGFRSLTLR